MSIKKNAIVLLEDEKAIRVGFKQQFEDFDFDFELVECSDYEAYESFLKGENNQERVKGFIMDLSNTPEEKLSVQFKSADYIQNQYNQNRVPIFVHSAYLEKYLELDEKGTVFKIPKSNDSTKKICTIIKALNESGFLDIFCQNGSLETKIMAEIHSAFVEQFKPDEIEKIIESVKSSETTNIKERTVEVFERIALRSVYQNFINKPKSQGSVKINAIEHYYRRNTQTNPFYTGDVFKSKKTDELIFIATPRCNISNMNFDEILLCKINPIAQNQRENFLNPKIDNKDSGETKGSKSLRTSITDDVTNSFIGERFRFLPLAPSFQGGFVDFKLIFSLNPLKFLSEYEYQISLVDDLTNDVIRKLTAYLQRGGISDTNYMEAQHYMKQIDLENISSDKK